MSSGLVVAFIAIGPALQAAFEWPYGVKPTRWRSLGHRAWAWWACWGWQWARVFGVTFGGLLAVLVASVAWKLGSVWSVRGLPQRPGRPQRWTLAPGAMGFASQMLAGGVVLMLACRCLLGEVPGPGRRTRWRWPAGPIWWWPAR